MNTSTNVTEDRIRVLKATANLQRLNARHQLLRLRQTPALHLTALGMGLLKQGSHAWFLKLLPRSYRLATAGWPVLQHLLSLSRKYHDSRQALQSAEQTRPLRP